MDVLNLLSEIEDIVDGGTTLPFSSKVMVDQFEILDIIKEIRIALPDDLERASLISKDKNKILEEANDMAESIIATANDTAEAIIAQAESTYHELVDKEEITQGAKKKADEIVGCAQDNAKEIQLGAMEYADAILDKTQKSLQDIISLIEDNRKELNVGEDCSVEE